MTASMEAVALHNFQATSDDELSFKKDTILKVLQFDGDWYKAEQNGRQGMVPKNYIEMRPHEWFMGNITREAAESVLLKKKKNGRYQQEDGGFLVRESSADDYSLYVKYKDGVQRFKVLRDRPAGKYFLWNVKFDSFNQLIEYHREVSVSPSDELCLSGYEEKETVTALHDFQPAESDELPFSKGDIITITSKEDPDWWTGECNGKSGVFPRNYVQE